MFTPPVADEADVDVAVATGLVEEAARETTVAPPWSFIVVLERFSISLVRLA
jgi:hypothetical protein